MSSSFISSFLALTELQHTHVYTIFLQASQQQPPQPQFASPNSSLFPLSYHTPTPESDPNSLQTPSSNHSASQLVDTFDALFFHPNTFAELPLGTFRTRFLALPARNSLISLLISTLARTSDLSTAPFVQRLQRRYQRTPSQPITQSAVVSQTATAWMMALSSLHHASDNVRQIVHPLLEPLLAQRVLETPIAPAELDALVTAVRSLGCAPVVVQRQGPLVLDLVVPVHSDPVALMALLEARLDNATVLDPARPLLGRLVGLLNGRVVDCKLVPPACAWLACVYFSASLHQLDALCSALGCANSGFASFHARVVERNLPNETALFDFVNSCAKGELN